MEADCEYCTIIFVHATVCSSAQWPSLIPRTIGTMHAHINIRDISLETFMSAWVLILLCVLSDLLFKHVLNTKTAKGAKKDMSNFQHYFMGVITGYPAAAHPSMP